MLDHPQRSPRSARLRWRFKSGRAIVFGVGRATQLRITDAQSLTDLVAVSVVVLGQRQRGDLLVAALTKAIEVVGERLVRRLRAGRQAIALHSDSDFASMCRVDGRLAACCRGTNEQNDSESERASNHDAMIGRVVTK